MTLTSVRTVAYTYNARWLTAAQVASGFVAPQQFKQLTNHCNTILVGPRGSGKTTLLKMLQQSALEAWNDPKADEYRESVDYTGVFIPADIGWREQLQALGGQKLDEHTHSLLVNATFGLHIVRAVIEAICCRVRSECDDGVTPFRRVTLSEGAEEEIVREIDRALSIGPKIPSLLSLRNALEGRISLVDTIARQEQLLGPTGREDRFHQHNFLFHGALAAANTCISIFDNVVGQENAKWALCFDELEIAPDSIQRLLMSSTRSAYPKILFKLALSPYNEHAIVGGGGSAPSADNDFDQIPLWYPQKDPKAFSGAKQQFCRDLWSAILKGRGYNEIDSRVAFGPAYFDSPGKIIASSTTPRRKGSSPYAPDGKWGTRFISLYESDPTFKSYLDSYDISPYTLEELTSPLRDSVVRKAAPIVGIREFYRRALVTEGRGASRSRKGIEIFTGAEAIFDISEGHPRWLKVTLGRLLDQETASRKPVIPRSMQGQELKAAAQKFAALLKTHPVDGYGKSGAVSSLLAVIKRIADYFHHQVVKGPFNPEPYLSFTVDSHIDDDLLNSLQAAVNLGAIVFVPDDQGQVMLTSLRGKRFRICYWLAPLYGLPISLGKAISLSEIIGKSRQEPTTLSLFDEDER